MAKYRVQASVTVSTYCIVEADDEKEAAGVASFSSDVVFQPLSPSDASDGYWVIDEMDGVPEISFVEECEEEEEEEEEDDDED
jgi:hypothetical protein